MEERRICVDSNILVDALAGIDMMLAEEFKAWVRDGVSLVAPDLIHYEVSHVATKHARNRKLTPTGASELLEAMLSLEIELIDDDGLHRAAIRHSLSISRLSGYDAQFLAVCERSGAELWTADQDFAAISQRLGIPTRLWVTPPA